MKRILVTNDDGVHSEGIKALADAMKTLGEVTVVAPLAEASAIGHALTLRRPLRIETIADRVYAVDGTPTDCVNIAITSVLRGMPDLVVSGINKGWNLGDDVTYSGTVSGAFEAALLGPPGIAVSLQKTGEAFDFSEAARGAHIVARSVLDKGLPSRIFLNINVPKGPTKGSRLPFRPGVITLRRSTSASTRAGSGISGSRKGRTSGSRTIAPTSRPSVTGTFP